MSDFCNNTSLISKVDEALYDKKEFDELVSKALSCINNSKSLHDKLESYYIQAMDFSIVDNLYDETIKKIESYI